LGFVEGERRAAVVLPQQLEIPSRIFSVAQP
jgi:hypothetical protein